MNEERRVIFKNELEPIILLKFKRLHWAFFLLIIGALNENDPDDPTVLLRYSDISRLMDESGNTNVRPYYLKNVMKKFCENIFKKDAIILNDEIFHLFSSARVMDDSVEIKINPDYLYLFHDFHRSFTQIKLEDILPLRSKYSIILFFHLSAFKGLGQYTVKADRFRRLMNVPEGYRERDIDHRVLDQCISELSEIDGFEAIRVKKRYSKAKGCPVDSYIFAWKDRKKNDTVTDELPFVEESENAEIFTDDRDREIDELWG